MEQWHTMRRCCRASAAVISLQVWWRLACCNNPWEQGELHADRQWAWPKNCAKCCFLLLIELPLWGPPKVPSRLTKPCALTRARQRARRSLTGANLAAPAKHFIEQAGLPQPVAEPRLVNPWSPRADASTPNWNLNHSDRFKTGNYWHPPSNQKRRRCGSFSLVVSSSWINVQVCLEQIIDLDLVNWSGPFNVDTSVGPSAAWQHLLFRN